MAGLELNLSRLSEVVIGAVGIDVNTWGDSVERMGSERELKCIMAFGGV